MCRLTHSGCVCVQDGLHSRLETLEERQAEQEQVGLERDLLYEQLCRLTDRAQTRARKHRSSTLQVPAHACYMAVPLLYGCVVWYVQVAQQVNQYQSKIKDTTRKTMALVSELTMKQVYHPMDRVLDTALNTQIGR